MQVFTSRLTALQKRDQASAEKNKVETAIALNDESGNFDSLIAAVIEAELVDTLSGNPQFTVFAPTDDGFTEVLGIGVASCVVVVAITCSDKR